MNNQSLYQSFNSRIAVQQTQVRAKAANWVNPESLYPKLKSDMTYSRCMRSCGVEQGCYQFRSHPVYTKRLHTNCSKVVISMRVTWKYKNRAVKENIFKKTTQLMCYDSQCSVNVNSTGWRRNDWLKHRKSISRFINNNKINNNNNAYLSLTNYK